MACLFLNLSNDDSVCMYLTRSFQIKFVDATGTAGMAICTQLLVLSSLSSMMANACELYFVAEDDGKYCPGNSIVVRGLLSHQCRYMCLQLASCRAYNCNGTDGTCTRFRSPCPQVFLDPIMKFGIFTEKPYELCYEWIPLISGSCNDERNIIVYGANRYRAVTRVQKTEMTL